MKGGYDRAKLAFEIFVHRLQAAIGAMIAVLEGIDALVFTAGIAENSTEERRAACANMEFVGLKLDARKMPNPPEIRIYRHPNLALRVLAVRAQEDWAIGRACWRNRRLKLGGTGNRLM